MINYFKYYYSWSKVFFKSELESTGRLRVTRENRKRSIIFGYFNLLVSICTLFLPFPFLNKVLVSIALFSLYIVIILLCDFSFIKMSRLYFLSKRKEKSIYTKIVYDHYFKNLSSKFTFLFNSCGIYKFEIEYSSSIKIVFNIIYKKNYKCIFKTNRVLLKSKKTREVISNEYQNMKELFDAISIILNR